MCYFFYFRDVDEVVRLSQSGVVDGFSHDDKGMKSGKCDENDGVVKELPKKKVREFKEPENDEVINDFSSKKFVQNSNNKIRWDVNLYSEWRKHRISKVCGDVEIVRCDLDRLNQFCKSDMSFALS